MWDISYAYMMYVCNTQLDSICVTLTITYACLQGIHDIVCMPHCLIYKLVTVTHFNLGAKTLQATGMYYYVQHWLT